MPNLPYKTSGWDTHAQVRLREIDYPLAEQEPTHYTVRRFYEGPSSTFGGFAALNTADTEFADAKLVWQSPLVPTDGGCIAYERLFATVPAAWSEPEEYAYPYPGFDGAPAYTASVAISAITAVSDYYIFSVSSNTIVAGEAVFYSFSFTRNGNVYFTNGTSVAIATTNGSQITLRIGLSGTGTISAVSGTIAKSSPITGATSPRTLVTASRVLHEYALTSAAAIATDLPLIDPFTIVTAAGEITNTLSATSVPTASAYLAFVSARQEIVAECTRRRYLGNIYVRRTRFVPAR